MMDFLKLVLPVVSALGGVWLGQWWGFRSQRQALASAAEQAKEERDAQERARVDASREQQYSARRAELIEAYARCAESASTSTTHASVIRMVESHGGNTWPEFHKYLVAVGEAKSAAYRASMLGDPLVGQAIDRWLHALLSIEKPDELATEDAVWKLRDVEMLMIEALKVDLVMRDARFYTSVNVND